MHRKTLLALRVAAVATIAAPALGQISLTGSSYGQNFDGMGAAGTTSPTGWFVGTGTGAVAGTTVVAGTGSSGTGANYNFGSSGSGERALGSVASGGNQRSTEVRFTNDTGAAISYFSISYTGEQWRNGGNTTAHSLTMQYSTNGTSFASMGSGFNFTGPIATSTAAALDGNLSANRVTSIGGIFAPSGGIATGSTFYLRWADPDDTGTDHGLAVDDFVFRVVTAQYWDISAAAGLGGLGTWSTSVANWTLDPTGATTPGTYTNGVPVVFDGTAANVRISGTVPVSSLVSFQADAYGLVTAAGGGFLNLASGAEFSVANAAHTATISALISGVGVTKSGPGNLVLSNTGNDFTGNVTISAGTLSVSSDGNLGNTANDIALSGGALKATSTINLDAGRDLSGTGGTVDVGTGLAVSAGGAVNLTGPLTLSGPGQLTLSAAGKSIAGVNFSDAGRLDLTNAGATIGGNVTTTHTAGTAEIDGAFSVGSASRTYTVGDGSAGVDLSIVSNITGSGRINKLGDGALELGGDNSGHSGGVTLGGTGVSPANGGTLRLTNKDAAGTGQLRLNNGTLSATTALTGANALSMPVTTAAPSTVNGGLGAVITGNVELSNSFGLFKTTGVSEYRLSVNDTVTVSGNVIASAGDPTAAGFTKGGSGTLIFSGATNSMTEVVTIAAGTLQIGNGGTTGSLGSGDLVNNSRLRFARSGSITVPNNISGIGRVQVEGTGTVSLTGTNTYNNTTTVSAGATLLVNGTHSGNSNYNVFGTLGGDGTITHQVGILDGGILAPGNSIGDLAVGGGVGGLFIDNGATYVMDVNAAAGTEDADTTIVTTGDVILNNDAGDRPTIQFVFTPGFVATFGTPPAGKTFLIINNIGSGEVTTDSQFAGAPDDTVVMDGLLKYTIDYNYSGVALNGTASGGNDIAVTFHEVPEPSTGALLALGVALTGRRRRR